MFININASVSCRYTHMQYFWVTVEKCDSWIVSQSSYANLLSKHDKSLLLSIFNSVAPCQCEINIRHVLTGQLALIHIPWWGICFGIWIFPWVCCFYRCSIIRITYIFWTNLLSGMSLQNHFLSTVNHIYFCYIDFLEPKILILIKSRLLIISFIYHDLILYISH